MALKIFDRAHPDQPLYALVLRKGILAKLSYVPNRWFHTRLRSSTGQNRLAPKREMTQREKPQKSSPLLLMMYGLPYFLRSRRGWRTGATFFCL